MEHGTFTLLVFYLSGGDCPKTSLFHKHIAQKIAKQENMKRSKH